MKNSAKWKARSCRGARLRIEAQQKLNKMQPESLGRASRISGVSPADIAVLMIWLKRRREAE